MRSCHWINALAGALATIVLPMAAAQAQPAGGPTGRMVVTWDTWVRAAPTDQSRAIDELGTGTPVEVTSCQNGWCRINEGQAAGYIPQQLLATALTRLQASPDRSTCFQAQYYTAEGPLGLDVCPAQPAPK